MHALDEKQHLRRQTLPWIGSFIAECKNPKLKSMWYMDTKYATVMDTSWKNFYSWFVVLKSVTMQLCYWNIGKDEWKLENCPHDQLMMKLNRNNIWTIQAIYIDEILFRDSIRLSWKESCVSSAFTLRMVIQVNHEKLRKYFCHPAG